MWYMHKGHLFSHRKHFHFRLLTKQSVGARIEQSQKRARGAYFMEKKNYTQPEIEVVEIAIEKGFAGSNTGDLEDPGFGGSF